MTDNTFECLFIQTHKKLVRAQLKLENAKKSHDNHCRTELDPESYAPCNCGADQLNALIDEILGELK